MVIGYEGTTGPDWMLRRLDGGLVGLLVPSRRLRRRPGRILADTCTVYGTGVVAMSHEEAGGVTRLEAANGSSPPDTLPSTQPTTSQRREPWPPSSAGLAASAEGVLLWALLSWHGCRGNQGERRAR